jgi:hypothetical protein
MIEALTGVDEDYWSDRVFASVPLGECAILDRRFFLAPVFNFMNGAARHVCQSSQSNGRVGHDFDLGDGSCAIT